MVFNKPQLHNIRCRLRTRTVRAIFAAVKPTQALTTLKSHTNYSYWPHTVGSHLFQNTLEPRGVHTLKCSKKWKNAIDWQSRCFPFNAQQDTMNIIILGNQRIEDAIDRSLDKRLPTVLAKPVNMNKMVIKVSFKFSCRRRRWRERKVCLFSNSF